MRTARSVTIVLGFLALTAIADAQQAGNASIRGVVTDEQAGVLPGVTVVATHQESGVFRETVSGADGSFIFVALVPGPYQVTADLSGFKKLTRRDVILAIGTTQTLDLKLEVGGLTEDVTVTANAALVDFTSAQVAANVSGGELKDLPSINRDFVGFVALLPGVQYNPSATGSNNVNVNGQNSSQVVYMFDGGSNNDDFRGGPTGTQVRTALEAIQEFQVITNQFDAEYGRATGGVVNAVMKQGTNRVRGSVFGYYTNSNMTAENYFVAQSNGTLPKPQTKKHQYGFTIGGPIVRDKVHFFSSYEQARNGLGITNTFPGRPDLNYSGTNGTVFYNFMNRIDHQVNANNTYAVRWLVEFQPNRNIVRETSTQDALDYELDTDLALIGSYNRVLGTTKFYALRISHVSEEIFRGCECGDYETTKRMDLELPTLRHLNFDSQHNERALHTYYPAVQVDQSLSWFKPNLKGDHDFKFGLSYMWSEQQRENAAGFNGIFTFASNRTFDAADPSTYPERVTVLVPGLPTTKVHSTAVGIYAQDKWRMNDKLTLSLGVRHDVDIAPFSEVFNPFFDDPGKYPVDWNNVQPRLGFAYRAGQSTVVRGGWGLFFEKLWTNAFEPYVLQGTRVSSFLANFPVDRADPGPSNGRLPTDPFLVNGPVVNRELLAQLYPAGLLTRNSGVVILDTPDRKTPYSRQVSIGIERQLGERWSFSADYVRNDGRNGVLNYDLNPAVRANTSRTGPITRMDFMGLANQLAISPFSDRVIIREFIGHTEYDGLSLQIERRFASAWSARASYTLGYSRGNTPGLAQGQTPDNPYQVLENRNLELMEGPSGIDRRHNLVISGRAEVPFLRGLTLSGVARMMSGRPFSIYDSSIDADRNGFLLDPLPSGTYSGTGQGAITVENDGGRNGAVGQGYLGIDVRLGYRRTLADGRTLDFFAETFNVSNEPNFVNPSGDRRLPTFLVPTSSFGGGQPRQMQIGARLGF